VLRRDPLAALTLWVLRAPSPTGPGWFKSAVAQPDLAIRKVRVEHDDELRRLSDTHHLGTRGCRSCIRLMTCACTETSSALTGSSAMTSFGFVASAREADALSLPTGERVRVTVGRAWRQTDALEQVHDPGAAKRCVAAAVNHEKLLENPSHRMPRIEMHIRVRATDPASRREPSLRYPRFNEHCLPPAETNNLSNAPARAGMFSSPKSSSDATQVLGSWAPVLQMPASRRDVNSQDAVVL
jgi:hypothetical protein